jgi:hypothetical protein
MAQEKNYTLTVHLKPESDQGVFGVWVGLYKDGELIGKNPSCPCPGNATFVNLEAGNYAIKVIKGKEFVGFETAVLPRDKDINITVGNSSTLTLNLKDQKGNFVTAANVTLLREEDGALVLKEITKDKPTELNVPAGNYTLIIKKDSRVLYNETIDLRESTPLPLERSFYSVKIEAKDSIGLVPDSGFDLKLRNLDTGEDTALTEVEGRVYSFEQLDKGNYSLRWAYRGSEYVDLKSFTLSGNITTLELNVTFPLRLKLEFSVFNERGLRLDEGDLSVVLRRDEIDLSEFLKGDKWNETRISAFEYKLPPGKYEVEIYKGEDLLTRLSLDITENKALDIITEDESLIGLIGIIIGVVAIGIAGFLLFYRKLSLEAFLMAISIALGITAILSPWWSLFGWSLFEEAETGNLYPLTHEAEVYLVPPTAIELTSFGDWVAGEEIHQLLDSMDVTFLLLLVTLVLLIIGYILVFGGLLLSTREKHRWRALTKNIAFLGPITLILGFIVSIVGIFATTGIFAGIVGSGIISGVEVPGTDVNIDVLSTYGFSYGFYLALISIGFAFAGYLVYNSKRKKVSPKVSKKEAKKKEAEEAKKKEAEEAKKKEAEEAKKKEAEEAKKIH